MRKACFLFLFSDPMVEWNTVMQAPARLSFSEPERTFTMEEPPRPAPEVSPTLQRIDAEVKQVNGAPIRTILAHHTHR